MKYQPTFYWYDYETFGSRPARDWPAQFAGVRTDAEFNEVGNPLEVFCRLPDDQLPQPQACLITGITPQKANEKGLCEAEFICRINKEFLQPSTCVVGYNSLSFDDEVTRFSLYRNFFDPYEREWKNGNSRWDLINTVRACAALRPEGINWPEREDGAVSFKLEALTQANELIHSQAHDAVSDVRATIALAKLIRKKQPKMFDYILSHKDKLSASMLLNISEQKPVIHISSHFSAHSACMAVVIPVAVHPVNKNEVIVYDLSENPETWLSLSTDELKERVFTANNKLQEKGLRRIPLKTVWLNRCPVLIPFNALRQQDIERLSIDQKSLERHYSMLKGRSDISLKIQAIFADRVYKEITDPDYMLYSGGFFNAHDKALIKKVSETSPKSLIEKQWGFSDKRLFEMLFRYRARNWPETLSDKEKQDWLAFCRQKLNGQNDDDNHVKTETITSCKEEINSLLANDNIGEKQIKILKELLIYIEKKEVFLGK